MAMWVRTLRLFPFVCTGKVRVITVVASMQSDNAINLHLRVSLRFDLAGHSGGRESNLGVALAFQDFLVHFVVATRISGVSAGSIHDYRAAGRAIGWIEMNCPTLKPESSVHGMESGCQCALDPGIRWIEFEGHFLRAKRFRVQANSRN
jgi:hypothetical protein